MDQSFGTVLYISVFLFYVLKSRTVQNYSGKACVTDILSNTGIAGSNPIRRFSLSCDGLLFHSRNPAACLIEYLGYVYIGYTSGAQV
jgi:hypothetical protein